MIALNRIIWSVGLLIIVTHMYAQSTDEKLKRIWELNSVEPLNGMGGIGEEMKVLDMRSDTSFILEVDGQTETISYKVIDQEIRLFNKSGNHVGQDIIWKIESLTTKELSLVLIAREENEKLARLKYRIKG